LGTGALVEPPTADVVAGCEAIRYALDLRSGFLLRERKFVREDWLFGVGVKRSRGDKADVESRAMQILETWAWLPGALESANPRPELRRRVVVCDSIVVSQRAEVVWKLVRPAEPAKWIVKHAVDAFHVAGTPEGVGEQQCTVLRYPEVEVRQVAEVVVDEPHQRLVLRHLSPDYGTTTTFELADIGEGTKLSMIAEYDEPGDRKAALRMNRAYQDSLADTLNRARRVLEGGWPTT
jgi:hypothetical protein